MSVTDIILSDVTDKNYGESGEKKLRTTCFLTPLVLVRDGHNYVGCDGQNYSGSGEKKLLTSCFLTPLVRVRVLIYLLLGNQ